MNAHIGAKRHRMLTIVLRKSTEVENNEALANGYLNLMVESICVVPFASFPPTSHVIIVQHCLRQQINFWVVGNRLNVEITRFSIVWYCEQAKCLESNRFFSGQNESYCGRLEFIIFRCFSVIQIYKLQIIRNIYILNVLNLRKF